MPSGIGVSGVGVSDVEAGGVGGREFKADFDGCSGGGGRLPLWFTAHSDVAFQS